jgi:hypothetical protein
LLIKSDKKCHVRESFIEGYFSHFVRSTPIQKNSRWLFFIFGKPEKQRSCFLPVFSGMLFFFAPFFGLNRRGLFKPLGDVPLLPDCLFFPQIGYYGEGNLGRKLVG